MMSKIQCLFCSETSITEGRGEKREGVQISKQAHRTFDIINSWPPVYLSTAFLASVEKGLH